jgi:hypothetical protein
LHCIALIVIVVVSWTGSTRQVQQEESKQPYCLIHLLSSSVREIFGEIDIHQLKGSGSQLCIENPIPRFPRRRRGSITAITSRLHPSIVLISIDLSILHFLTASKIIDSHLSQTF